MNPFARVLGPIELVGANQEFAGVNYGELVQQLILSEQFILDSGRLEEFPALVKKFGYDGVIELLDSGLMTVHCDFVVGAGPSQPPEHVEVRRGQQVDRIEVMTLTPSDHKEHVHRGLQGINQIKGLTAKRAQKLRKAIGERVNERPHDHARFTTDQFMTDVRLNSPQIRFCVADAASKETGRAVDPLEFEFSVREADGNLIETTSNLGPRLSLDEATTHRVVRSGLLAAASLNYRFELMNHYGAITGFREREGTIFEQKLNFVAERIDPDRAVARLGRVVEVCGLPEIDPRPNVHDVDLCELIQIVQGNDVVEFRRWLMDADDMTDEEIRDELTSMRSRVGNAVGGTFGRVVRFLVTTGIGLVPGTAGMAGIAVDAIDTSLVDKAFPGSRPAAFLGNQYKSIFVEGQD